jgi:hypothetical protein
VLAEIHGQCTVHLFSLQRCGVSSTGFVRLSGVQYSAFGRLLVKSKILGRRPNVLRHTPERFTVVSQYSRNSCMDTWYPKLCATTKPKLSCSCGCVHSGCYYPYKYLQIRRKNSQIILHCITCNHSTTQERDAPKTPKGSPAPHAGDEVVHDSLPITSTSCLTLNLRPRRLSWKTNR